MTANILSGLVDAGIGGLVILVVYLFLKFLRDERINSSAEHKEFMSFIADQRRENNAAVGGMAQAVTGLCTEVKLMREEQHNHNKNTSDAINEMRAKAMERRKPAEATE